MYKTFTTYAGSPTKEVQYISLENCKTDNERSLFEIYDYYVGILNKEHETPPEEMTTEQWRRDCETREFANDTRNEAAAILNSVLQGYPLALLQAKFLSKFNQYYRIGKAKYSTNFEYFLAHNAKSWYNPDTKRTYFYSGIAQNVEFCSEIGELSTERINEVCKEIHKDLLAAKFGNGKFVQC